MALDAVRNSIEDLPAEIREHYTQGEGAFKGKFVLDVTPDGSFQLSDDEPLRRALAAERQEIEKVKARMREFEGLDAEEARKAIARVEEIANRDPDATFKTKWEAHEKQLLTKHKEEKEALLGENKTLTGRLEDLLITSAATKAISEAKGDVGLLMPHVRNYARIKKGDGDRFVVQITDPDTGTPLIGDSDGNPETIPGLINNVFRKAFPRAFDSGTPSGTGTGGADKTKTPAGVDRQTVESGGVLVVDDLEGVMTGKIPISMD